VTTVGELKSLKGQDDFLKAAAAVTEKFPNAKFAVVGRDHSKDGKFRSHLENIIQKRDLSKKILWTDECHNVDSVLEATDIFVSASHTESFGLSILEAMAAGCAVVATATAGANELLKNEGTGKLVPIQSAEKIADAVSDFLSSEKLRKQFGLAARKIAKSEFSFSEMINSTEQIYFQCLAEKRMENFAAQTGISILPENHLARL